MPTDFRIRNLEAIESINTVDLFSQRYVCSGDILSQNDYEFSTSGNILIGETTCLTNNLGTFMVDYNGGASFQDTTVKDLIATDSITVSGENVVSSTGISRIVVITPANYYSLVTGSGTSPTTLYIVQE